MLDPDDLINYELCFPEAVTGSTEINCPHCSEVLTVSVEDPMGTESYQCSSAAVPSRSTGARRFGFLLRSRTQTLSTSRN